MYFFAEQWTRLLSNDQKIFRLENTQYFGISTILENLQYYGILTILEKLTIFWNPNNFGKLKIFWHQTIMEIWFFFNFILF